MRFSLAIAAGLVVAAAPGASQTVAPPAPGGPIIAHCPTAEIAVRPGRILGIPIPAMPGGPLLAPIPPTPEFGGTTYAHMGSGMVGARFFNRWASAGKTTFSHILHGPARPVRLTLETCSTASGGETIAIYPATTAGLRMPRRPRYIFSIANRRGNVRQATVHIPQIGREPGMGTLHFAVVVENASGRFHQGAYRLTLEQ